MHAIRVMPMAAACVLLLLAGCGNEEESTSLATPPAPANAPGLDAAQQALYDTYCRVCHGAKGTGAPLSGSITDWQPRAATGMPTLLQHAIEGYKGMPPMGGCFTCSEDDMRVLVAYMSAGLAQ